MLRRVQKYIRDHRLLENGDRVLVCVSGGADSIALLDVLRRGGYDCVVAHCNFHLRGAESDRDMDFVEQSVRAASTPNRPLPLRIRHFDTLAEASAQGKSIELMARELRYTWFDQLARLEHCRAIAVAHHQNDQAETVLLNLKRGSGIRGLCGMRASSYNAYGMHSGSGDTDGEHAIPIIRPLLCTTRDYIEHYLRDIRHIAWIDDSSNRDTSIPRNAIRAQLASLTKADIEHIAATAERMQGYVDWLEKRDTPQAACVKLFESLRPYHFPQTDEIFQSLQSGHGGKVFLSATHKAEIKHGQLCITTL